MINKDLPLVSVVIRTHNRPNLLACAINSVIKQTYGPVDILIIDHESTGETEELVRSYGPKVRYYKHNGNFRDTFNVWRDKVLGEFICVLDDDDYLSHDCIEKLMRVLLLRHDVDIVFPRHKIFSHVNNLQIFEKETERVSCSNMRKKLIHGNVIPWNGVIFRRECLRKIPQIDDSITGAYDWCFWILMELAGCKFYQVDEILGYIRRGEDSVQFEILRMVKGVVECLELYGEHLKLSEKVRHGYFHVYGYRLICTGIVYLEEGDIKNGRFNMLRGLYYYILGLRKMLKLVPALMIYIASFVSEPQMARVRTEKLFGVYLFRNYHQIRKSRMKLRIKLFEGVFSNR
ncbi:MAG: glycosyltransferase [Deltaproteobacteria bacterium]|nr:glycosyltransferase [Deltaproteobacteria bacterium]MBW2009242.1 glycosyltransferase [Deltaproteobacteria bacterium]